MHSENSQSRSQIRGEGLTALVAKAAAGNAEAYSELVTRFQDMAVSYAYSILGDFHMAQDVAQEAFIAGWQLLPQLRELAGFPGWLRRIVFKYCDRITRKKAVAILSLEAFEEHPASTPGPAELLESQDWRHEVVAAVQLLPAAEREVVMLFYFGSQSQGAIGQFLGIPEATVKSRLFSARKKLKQRMLPMLEESGKSERPSRDQNFARRVIGMIRPSDRELGASGGSLGCDGAAIWEMMCAAVAGDVAAIKALLAQDEKLASAEYWYTQPLHYAVREGHLEAVKVLLEAGADPTHIRYGGQDLKIVALDRGHNAVAQWIEAAQKQRLGETIRDHEIHQAIASGDEERVRALLENAPELVAVWDSKGRQPLHLAVNAGNLALVELLIGKGADLEARTGASDTYLPAEFTPIDFALWRNDWWVEPRLNAPMAQLLLRHGANYSMTVAAALGDTERVEALLQQDPVLANAPQPSGRRPLSAAVQFGHQAIARRLLEAGADPNLPEGRYCGTGCALYFAAQGKQPEMVDLLLAHSANPESAIDSCGSVYNVADELTRIKLYQHGLQPELDVENVDALAIWAAKDPEGLARAGCGTVFTFLCMHQYSEEQKARFSDEKQEAMVRMLLAMGVKVPPVVTGCRSYLWNKPHLTRILLEHGMDPNLPNWQLETPLHSICNLDGRGRADSNRLELARLFLEFGADINARDEEYRSTPLGWAARNGLVDIVEFLLSQGAAPSLPDDDAWATPLAWAKKRGHQEIVVLLEKAG